jgi:hypothetical protein
MFRKIKAAALAVAFCALLICAQVPREYPGAVPLSPPAAVAKIER